ncbi:MAG: diaminopimelate epimerase, partial [Pseudomonadota bacterium]|nr:diaminopimelate epimerase [Pseudomonadota bacterium]
RGLLDTPVKVIARGGELTVEWNNCATAAQSVLMTGTATTVFVGEIEI